MRSILLGLVELSCSQQQSLGAYLLNMRHCQEFSKNKHAWCAQCLHNQLRACSPRCRFGEQQKVHSAAGRHIGTICQSWCKPTAIDWLRFNYFEKA
jgi:hypothetical protein